MKKHFYYTPQQEQYIRDNYQDMTGKELAKALGVKPCALYKKAEMMGLRKCAKRNGEPYQKEIKGKVYWMVNRNRKGLFLHRLNWIEKHGPIPAGYHLRCKGDYSDPSPENWELITKAEHGRRNHDPEKAGKAIKAKWDKAKRWQAMGMKVHFTKYQPTKKKTYTKSIQTEPAKHIQF